MLHEGVREAGLPEHILAKDLQEESPVILICLRSDDEQVRNRRRIHRHTHAKSPR